jgi:hypothetical protein
MSTCTGCESGLDHCHGTLLVHGDGARDCTDGECALDDPLRHALVVDCFNVVGGCCAEPEKQDFAQAS